MTGLLGKSEASWKSTFSKLAFSYLFVCFNSLFCRLQDKSFQFMLVVGFKCIRKCLIKQFIKGKDLTITTVFLFLGTCISKNRDHLSLNTNIFCGCHLAHQLMEDQEPYGNIESRRRKKYSKPENSLFLTNKLM